MHNQAAARIQSSQVKTRPIIEERNQEEEDGQMEGDEEVAAPEFQVQQRPVTSGVGDRLATR